MWLSILGTSITFLFCSNLGKDVVQELEFHLSNEKLFTKWGGMIHYDDE
jgi:hypothetical protein